MVLHIWTGKESDVVREWKVRMITIWSWGFPALVYSSVGKGSGAYPLISSLHTQRHIQRFYPSICRHTYNEKPQTSTNRSFSLITDDGSALQNALEEMTGQRSVPNIFIAKEHIGGNSDLQAKKSQLKNMLKEANAL